MDALKSAGRAIIRSPSMAKQSWTAGRHRSKKNKVEDISIKRRVDFRLALCHLYLNYSHVLVRNNLTKYFLKYINSYDSVMECRTKVKASKQSLESFFPPTNFVS